MIAVIQRVSQAGVTIEGNKKAEIKQGLVVLIGIEGTDTEEDAHWLANKIAYMRIFHDENDKMNLSVMDVVGEILVISQFTLHASTKKGNRPSFIKAAKPDYAIPLYEQFLDMMELAIGKPVHSGEFGADMKVDLINDGPVTIVIDTKNKQ
ncbi:MAG: D-aminoacyl-tRNA deacylase [Candidatus Cyclobacteriaceae bacterium M2_1C_046]